MQEEEQDKEKCLRKFGWLFTPLMRQGVFYGDGRAFIDAGKGAGAETGTEKIPRGYRYPAGTTTVRYDVSFVGLVSCTTR